MLHADKAALERELRVSMLSLQWKELQYLHSAFQNLATSSAVLVGFGFSALGISSAYHPEQSTAHSSVWELVLNDRTSGILVSEIVFQAIFSIAASFALAFNLLSLFISTISSMCGPGMALRGPEGSVALAVRHMEEQLKRALRFFGRGVVAFILTLAAVGLRNLQDVGFVGGVMTLFIGVWTFYACWSYGLDIGEKFHVSSDRAVRGTFVSGPTGQQRWQNTESERAAQMEENARRWCWWQRRRWRPPGHSSTTPLWRLDKIIAFPYYDDAARLRADPSTPARQRDERQQMETLVLNAQGPVEGAAGPSSSSQPQDGDLNPRHYLSMMSSAFASEPRLLPGKGRSEE